VGNDKLAELEAKSHHSEVAEGERRAGRHVDM